MKYTDNDTPEPRTRGNRATENLGHRGNGNPNRPSVQKRRAARAAERKRLAKNAAARERRAAAKKPVE